MRSRAFSVPMRTRLFHTIIACGATLGVAAACSGNDDGSPEKDAGPHHDCVPVTVLKAATGGSAAVAAPAEGGLGGVDDGGVVGCGGWPPTK
jgi:hypothetical protein